ncbi:hypothetical protein BKA61DRAFT_15079 [Leptodontidium sp. MPI-SDFR-AT-0119]|nr:hypothetical protein BKA61DRAFT_15079 [Leptodontidium sp. MPI-SDFR-AT-0119]
MVLPVMFGLLLACFLFTLLGTVSSQSVSITDESAFSSQRRCAQGCMGSSDSGPLFLASELSCAKPYDNSCFCRSDLQQKAESYLKSCVNSACTNTLDASSAVSIYDAYCTSAGFVKAAVTTAATTAGTQTAQSSSANSMSTGIGLNIDSSTSVSSAASTASGNGKLKPLLGIEIGSS